MNALDLKNAIADRRPTTQEIPHHMDINVHYDRDSVSSRKQMNAQVESIIDCALSNNWNNFELESRGYYSDGIKEVQRRLESRGFKCQLTSLDYGNASGYMLKVST